MICPNCEAGMTDVTAQWHTFAAAEGAEYLADYVAIWHCSACQTIAGGPDELIEWVIDPEDASVDEKVASSSPAQAI